MAYCTKLYIFLLIITSCQVYATNNYDVGVGIYDVTGPAAEVNMMGYANPSQKSRGIHLRQFSRAFIVVDHSTNNRVVVVNVDACMISDIVKSMVAKKVRDTLGYMYNETNILLSAIHTHSGPAGFHQYLLFDVTSFGFVKQAYEALVNGIAQSIINAHHNIKPGRIFINQGQLFNASINRSPYSYLQNPISERNRYKTNVDTTMTVLKFTDTNLSPIGMLSIFPVHCTSMNFSNGLISSDNKGLAALMMEETMTAGQRFIPGKVPFVAAFMQANEGDVSPNTKGPICIDTGLPCDFKTSTCNGKSEKCIAFGPGKDMYESTHIIAKKQFDTAKNLFDKASREITGKVEFVHQFVDMSNVTVLINSTKKVKTCKPAMGYAFAAGTTDGPGAFDFHQDSTSSNPFWAIISGFLSKPSPEQKACHAPKPILLNTGEMSKPYSWQQSILPTQMLRIGPLVIVGLPGEFTTMSGRRIREAVYKTLAVNNFQKDMIVVLSGLANGYSDYIATYEEYQVQRYEAGSTPYGPHTLSAYIQQFETLAAFLAKGMGSSLHPGPHTPNLLSKQWSLLPGVIFDNTPLGKSFGNVLTQPSKQYKAGAIVEVQFVSADPRNSLMTNATFSAVEYKSSNGWTTVRTDGHWDTKFRWLRTSTLLAHSKAIIEWTIDQNVDKGIYRIRHFGVAKSVLGKYIAFQGMSNTFMVL